MRTLFCVVCCRSGKYGGLKALTPLQSRPNPSSKAEADRLADQLNIFAKLEEILDAVHQHRQETRDGFLGVNEQLTMLREELQALKQENARLRKRGASEDEVRGGAAVIKVSA